MSLGASKLTIIGWSYSNRRVSASGDLFAQPGRAVGSFLPANRPGATAVCGCG
jgi:hypothetical protein